MHAVVPRYALVHECIPACTMEVVRLAAVYCMVTYDEIDELCVAFLDGNDLLLFGVCLVRHLLQLSCSSVDHYIKAVAKTTTLDCTLACFWGICCYINVRLSGL